MVNDTPPRPCERVSAGEGEISLVFEKENKLRNSMPHFSLMFHRDSSCAVKVKIFVLNVLEHQLLLPGLEKKELKKANCNSCARCDFRVL